MPVSILCIKHESLSSCVPCLLLLLLSTLPEQSLSIILILNFNGSWRKRQYSDDHVLLFCKILSLIHYDRPNFAKI